VRLTVSQIAMNLLVGETLPFVAEGAGELKARIQSGRRQLVSITGQDFNFDLQQWHDYLCKTNCGGYRWSNKHLGMPKLIAKALNDQEWQQAVLELKLLG
jgi:hypothetical protein